jgi:hypothetical protein
MHEPASGSEHGHEFNAAAENEDEDKRFDPGRARDNIFRERFELEIHLAAHGASFLYWTGDRPGEMRVVTVMQVLEIVRGIMLFEWYVDCEGMKVLAR